MKKYSKETISELIQAAAKSPRKRSHLNIHDNLDAPVQRLLIALQPDTYVRPHFHPEEDKVELITLLKGSCLAVTFSEQGEILDSMILDTENSLMEFPPLTWHSLICLEHDTLILEVKKGPYQPLEAKYFANWAPAEGDSKSADYLKQLKQQLHGN
ncbi:MAG: WbuC family cupin fold metalloprotein [Lentisphaerales bacterium]|nr:WbuC family cupin fold metalloprotein [Lentisphaerales bacterium]